jgi:hypothetical protein
MSSSARALVILLLAGGCAASPPRQTVANICTPHVDCHKPASAAPAPRDDDGVEGGVEGTPDPDAPPGAKMIPPKIGIGQRLANLRDPRHALRLRRELAVPGAYYWGLFKICVADSGQVHSVRVMKSTGVPAIDYDWVAAMKRWPYRPYSLNGRPVPFCHPLRADFRVM